MLVVVCNEHDDAAQRLVAAWPDDGAARLTTSDLSTAGWRVRVPDDAAAIAVVGGRRVQAKDITAVLVRCPAIQASDLPHIMAQDRAFVAAEMTAFLAAWLASLRCRVINRPTATCLCGPPWRRVQWVHVACTLGIPAEPVRWAAAPGGVRSETPCEPSITVTAIGEHCVGAVDDQLKQRTRKLASAANVEMLAARFTGPRATDRFVTASVYPDLQDPAIVETLRDVLARDHSGAMA